MRGRNWPSARLRCCDRGCYQGSVRGTWRVGQIHENGRREIPRERLRALDRVPMPSDRAIQNTLDITYRIAPKLAAVEIKRRFYFGAVQRLRNEGFIDRLYK